MKIIGLDHIVITASDLQKTLNFYIEVLGMTHHVAKSGQHMARCGNQQINFHNGPREFLPAATSPLFGSADICLVAQGELEQIKTELEEKGVVVEVGVVETYGARGSMQSIYFRDPDGNLIEICVYPQNPH